MHHSFFAPVALLALLLVPRAAFAQACDTSDTTARACLASLGAEARPGLFATADGRRAWEIPLGRYIRGAEFYPTSVYIAGSSTRCAPAGHDAHDYAFAANALDCYAVVPYRHRAGGAGVPDGDPCCYDPAGGVIYDLGGEVNRVALFAMIDHGPLPCEAFEYSVYLSDNADATDVVLRGSDPDGTKWNEALLIRSFAQGWDETGDADGLTTVWALPCGITFRYASLVAGNRGNPSAACTFHSVDAEIDAVAGLNEDDTAVCPDADGDGFRARSCGGTDCDDTDRTINPGAVETCATPTDRNCDGMLPNCPSGTTCVQGICAAPCVESACATDFTCITPDGGGGNYCLPSACADRICPSGQVCGPMGCQDPCAGARCPGAEVCRGGACVAPCAGVMCPPRQHCDAGRCVPDCSCVSCGAGTACNNTSGRCEAPGCEDFRCPDGTRRDCTGTVPRCVARCAGVVCPLGARCDPSLDRCVIDRCFGVACAAGSACVEGACVRIPDMDAGTRDAGGDATISPDAGRDAGRMDAGRDAGRFTTEISEDAGCGCTAPRARADARALAALFFVTAVLRRRAASRRGRSR